VIIAAFAYLTDDGPGLIARYARGADYHEILESRLNAALSEMTERYGVKGKVSVDKRPVPEVAAARAAGVGKTGRHGLCIVPGYGSYVSLGAIILDTDAGRGFTDVPPSKDAGYCGGCNACIRACPTGALGAETGGDGTPPLRREKCLSYITQAKTLTTEQESLLRKNPRHWGCDACQEACPENRGAAKTELPEFYAPGIVRAYTPGMSIEGRAFAWRGRAVLERNRLLLPYEPDTV
jgi:epoxyqueuosine reductase